MERAVTPAECALAVALPLTFHEYAADVGSSEHDFVRSVVEGSGRSLHEAWDELYAPKVVQICERVAGMAHGAGATVLVGVTLASLRALLAEFPVVCLVAHSVQVPIEAADVLRPAEILRIIEAGESVVARYLRSKLAGRNIWKGEGAALPEQIAAFLDGSLEATREWMGSTARRDQRLRPELHVDRVILEDCFGEALRPGRLLELRDGMITMADLLAAIPLDFGGVLDLSVCNSVALGESIKRRRPHCLVVENTFLARIDLRLARYALALTLLARGPARYTDVLHRLTREILRNSQ